MTPKSRSREGNQRGRVSAEAQLFAERLLAAGFSRRGKWSQYRQGAACFLSFLAKRGRNLADVTLDDWSAFRGETTAERGQGSARNILQGARAFLRMKADDGLLSESQVPTRLAAHPMERLSQEGRQEVLAFKARLRAKHTSGTVCAYSWGTRELLLFLDQRKTSLATMTPADFSAFEESVSSRAAGGEISKDRAELALNGARYYLREKAQQGSITDEALLRIASPACHDVRREVLVRRDPSLAQVFREVDTFEERRRAMGYSANTREGALALLRFLASRGRKLQDITQADWHNYRLFVESQGKRNGHGHPLLTGAWAYLRMKAREGVIHESQVPPVLRKCAAGPALPPGLASYPRILDEGMEASDFAATTRPSYRRALRDFLVWLAEQGITALTSVTRDVVTAYRLHIQSCSSIKGTPYSIRTQIGVLTALRFFFSWLVRTGQLLSDPTIHLPNPRLPERLPRGLKVKQVARLFSSVPKTPIGQRDRALLELLYGTGMRRGELANLTLDDVDLEQRTILIRQGKGRKDRMVPLGKKARDVLLTYIEEARPSFVRGTDPGYVFLGLGGRKISITRVTGRVRELGRRIFLHVGPHALRHSCATHLLKGRADIRHIQRLLGHKSLSTTERYTKVEVSDLRSVIERCHPREKRPKIP